MWKVSVLSICLLVVILDASVNPTSASSVNPSKLLFGSVADTVYFFLYNQPASHYGSVESGRQLNVKDATTFQNTGIDASKPLFILVHGFIQTHGCAWPQDIKDAYLQLNTGINVITVDWSDAACAKYATNQILALACYPTAALKVDAVGQAISDLIGYLYERGQVNPDNVRIIGASLGAHVSGEAGSRFAQKYGRKISRITALDPGGPGFTCGGARCLTKNDANFVDAMHTDAGGLGTTQVVGQVDFYPNGGKHPQPSCEDKNGECSHGTCAKYWLQSIGKSDIIAYKCDSYSSFTSGACSGEGATTTVFGEESQPGSSGSYYLNIVPGNFSGRYVCYQ